jgi:hypothetical protein
VGVAVGADQSPVRLLVQQMTRKETARGLARLSGDVARRRHRELEGSDSDARHGRHGAGREFDPREAPFSIRRAQPSSA